MRTTPSRAQSRTGPGVVKDGKLKPPHPANTQQAIGSVPFAVPRSPVWYASDCSGLDGGAVAMGRERPDFIHWFGSEIEKGYRKVFTKMHPHCVRVFENCMKRDLQSLMRLRHEHPEDPLVYTSGFPCQPYSKEGKRGGELDPRSQVGMAVAETIHCLKPDLFILENVEDLVENPKFADFASKLLEKLGGANEYYVDFKVLDSINFGVPAARRRVYIVGIRRDRLVQSWSWPEDVAPAPSLASILEPRSGGRTDLDKLSTTALKNLAKCFDIIKKDFPGADPCKELFVPHTNV